MEIVIALITLTVVGSILGLRLPNERYAVNFSKFPSTNNVQAPPPENKTESQYIGERVPNCKWLFLGKTSERKFTEEYMKNHTKQHPSVKEIVKKSNNCSSLISLGYLVKRHTLIEHDFPIAFAIHVRKNIVQTERLLRMIYRPQNMYCIHLNGSVAPEQYHAAKAISKCFSNVFVVKDFQTHANDHFARVQGELNCMKFIANQGQDWKYYLNIDDSSLPLKTNWEMINILGVYDGANDFEGTSRNDSIPWKSMRVIERKNNTFVLTNKVKGPPPHGIKNLVRGKEYGIFSWEFVKFILNDKRAKDFIEWSKDTVEPEKYLWTSLHHTCYHPGLKTPGGYSGVPDQKLSFAMFSLDDRRKCGGQMSQGQCVFGLSDLRYLRLRKDFFAQKFDQTFHHYVYDCMEERMKESHQQDGIIMDLSFYKKQPFVY